MTNQLWIREVATVQFLDVVILLNSQCLIGPNFSLVFMFKLFLFFWSISLCRCCFFWRWMRRQCNFRKLSHLVRVCRKAEPLEVCGHNTLCEISSLALASRLAPLTSRRIRRRRAKAEEAAKWGALIRMKFLNLKRIFQTVAVAKAARGPRWASSGA